MFGKHLSRCRLALVVALALCSASPAFAQPAGAVETAPMIQGVLRNSNLVLERLQTVLNLTDQEDQKQYDTLKEYIELFLIGVDRTKPVRMDVFFLDDSTSNRLDVPVLADGFTNFWKFNLVPLGIPVQQFAKRPNTFRLGGRRRAAFTGYMLYDPNQRGGYATIVEHANLFPRQNGQAPTQGVQNLLNKKYDAAMQLQNDPDGVEARHERFSADKSAVLDELKRQSNESEAEFALRKFAAGVQFDETERIFAEAKNLIAGGAVESDPAKAQFSFTLEALPETPLANSIDLLGQKPSRFAGVPVPEAATSTGRINFPLDEFRKQHFLAMSKQFRETEIDEAGKIEAGKIEGATDAQITATRDFLNALFDRIDTGLEEGTIDAFMDMTKNEEGIYTVVGGAVSPQAGDWVPVLEMATTLKDPPSFKKNVGKVGDVSLHEITFAEGKNPEFEGLFGGPRLVIGTGGDTVWYAAGPEADAQLKAAIEAADESGEASQTVISFQGELLPAFKILEQRRGEEGRTDLRTRAIEAFQNGQGQLNLNVTRQESAVTGTMNLDAGVLRLIGASLAEISRENLAE